jgi:hypothetical protein
MPSPSLIQIAAVTIAQHNGEYRGGNVRLSMQDPYFCGFPRGLAHRRMDE